MAGRLTWAINHAATNEFSWCRLWLKSSIGFVTLLGFAEPFPENPAIPILSAVLRSLRFGEPFAKIMVWKSGLKPQVVRGETVRGNRRQAHIGATNEFCLPELRLRQKRRTSWISASRDFRYNAVLLGDL